MEKQQKIEKLIRDKSAVLEYRGKSKDVYRLPNGNVLLVFGDAFTGTDGKEDPGGNQNIGTKAGLGHKNLQVSWFLFEQISKNLKIPSQNVWVDFEVDALEATSVSMFGKNMPFEANGKEYVSAGLEFIARNRAWGSYLKRNPKANQGDNLCDTKGLPFVEVSVKHDAAGDPIFSRSEFIKMGINSAQYDTAVDYTARITKFLTELFAAAGLELIDIKMEFGTTKTGEVVLSDEISPGSLRALIGGVAATKEQTYENLMKYKKENKL